MKHALPLLTALLLAPLATLQAAETRRPNILIVINDAQSWLECSAYGNSSVQTPAFDRVAKAGVLFTHGYCSAQAVHLLAGLFEPHHPHASDGHLKVGVGLDAVKIPGFMPDTPGVRRARGDCLCEVQHADRTLGALLKLLEDRGELANTLVIVTADNGSPIPRAKANVYDPEYRN